MIFAQTDVLKIIETLGVAVGCLIILAFGVWRALIWLGNNVLKPIADRHIKFIDEISENIKKQSNSIVDLAENSKGTISRLEEVVTRLEEVARNVLAVRNVVVKTDNITLLPPGGTPK